MTCEEYDAALKAMPEEECWDAKITWKIDVEFFCGCEGSQLETSVDGGCSVCSAGDKIDNADNVTVTGGYPLTAQLDGNGTVIPITCQYVFDVAPVVKYSTTCEEFQNWYGTGVCCTAGTSSEAPTPAATPVSETGSSTAAIHKFGCVALSLIVGAAAAVWYQGA